MSRLGLLPLEIEERFWRRISREERLRKLGCKVVGDVNHFLHGCAALTTATAQSLKWHNVARTNATCPHTLWRSEARKLERRWKERTQAVQRPQPEPENPADAQDDAFLEEIDIVFKRQRTPADIRFIYTAE